MDNELHLILSKMKILDGLTEDEIKTIAPYGEKIQFPAEKIIIRERENSPGLYILISGTMEVYLAADARTRHRISDVNLCRMERGDCVGEYSLIDGNPASATVKTLENCIIFHISPANFAELREKHPVITGKIFFNMLKVLVARAREYDIELDMVL